MTRLFDKSGKKKEESKKMEDRRAARRRKILQNADDRLKRVVRVQSEARNNTEGGNETENDKQTSSTYSENETGLEKNLGLDETSGLRSDAPTPQRISEAIEVTGQETNESHDVGNDIDCGTSSSRSKGSKLQQDIVGSPEAEGTQTNVTKTFETLSQAEHTSPGDPNLDSDSGGDTVGPNSNKTDNKFYRMALIAGLAILLVLISNLEVFKETRYEAVRNTSFLPYFITLEIINLCLFPVDSDIEDSSLTPIILKAAGLTDQTISTLIMVLRFSSRTLQDFALFVFTIVLANHTLTE